jgi:hypothetical protein
MSLKYYLSATPTWQTNSDFYKNDFQALANLEHENAPNFYYILRQNNPTDPWSTVGVRITPSYQIKQLATLKDDYKTLIYQDFRTNVAIGELYQFSGYTWLTVDTGRTVVSSSSCQVCRCADFLRFYDDAGVFHKLPCVLQRDGYYDLATDQFISLPNNTIRALVRWDTESKLIKWANVDNPTNKFSRFILESKAYKTVSINPHSYVRLGVGYVEIRFQEDLIKPGIDNLVDGIADDIQGVTVHILNGATSIGVGQTLQLNTSVKRNSIVIDNPTLTYVSATPTVASVNSNGLVTGLTSGSSYISASYAGISDSVDITIASVVNNYTIDFTASNSNLTSVKLGEQVTYTAIPRNNGVAYTSPCTFSVVADDGISSTSLATVVSQTSTQVVIKCASTNSNVGAYFKVKVVDAEMTSYIRLQVKSIF